MAQAEYDVVGGCKKLHQICQCKCNNNNIWRLMALAAVGFSFITPLYLMIHGSSFLHTFLAPPCKQPSIATNEQPPPSPPAIIDTSNLAEELREDADVRLERVLKEAVRKEDNTVIVTTLNAAWSEPGSIIDLFLESFRMGNGTQQLLNHLLIVAMDINAYAHCKAIHPHCFALSAAAGLDFSKHQRYNSKVYLEMTWIRTKFLTTLLQKGYNFIFTDSDIMWFRDPFPQFNAKADLQIACDDYRGDPESLRNYANGGFLYVRASNRTVALYKFWQSLRKKYGGNDQDVFNKMKHYPYIKEIGVKLWFLHTDYFSDLCQPTKSMEKVCTMHPNCCLQGLDAKLHDLRIMLDDWTTYNQRISGKKTTRGAKNGRYSWSLLKMKCG